MTYNEYRELVEEIFPELLLTPISALAPPEFLKVVAGTFFMDEATMERRDKDDIIPYMVVRLETKEQLKNLNETGETCFDKTQGAII